jgi:hypothetical protein
MGHATAADDAIASVQLQRHMTEKQSIGAISTKLFSAVKALHGLVLPLQLPQALCDDVPNTVQRLFILTFVYSDASTVVDAVTTAVTASRRCSPDDVDDEDCNSDSDGVNDNDMHSSGVAAVDGFSANSSADGGSHQTIATSGVVSSLSSPSSSSSDARVGDGLSRQSSSPIIDNSGLTTHLARGAASKRSENDNGVGSGVASGGEDPSSSPSSGRRSGGGGAGATSGGQLAVNVGLIVGVSVGIVVALLLAGLAVYKYRSRDEGTYRLDPDARNGYAGYRPCTVAGSGAAGRAHQSGSSCLAPVVGESSATAVDCIDVDDNGGGCRSRSGSGSGGCVGGGTVYRLRNFRSRPKGRRDVKEWYV